MTEEQALTITDEEWEAMQRRAHEEEVAALDADYKRFASRARDGDKPRPPAPEDPRFPSEPVILWNRWSPNHPQNVYEERLARWEREHGGESLPARAEVTR